MYLLYAPAAQRWGLYFAKDAKTRATDWSRVSANGAMSWNSPRDFRAGYPADNQPVLKPRRTGLFIVTFPEKKDGNQG